MELKANIFDIQGLSVHDGPGCRTLIFMQGCTLNCKWCSNPEGISWKPVLVYNVEKCRLDGNCVRDCTFNAIEIKDNRLVIHRELCKDCNDYSCLKNCYTKALRVSAKEMSIPELMKIVQRDRQFWGNGGGITLSGGEPLLQIDFAEG
ncbi:Pyruvate formate-lyase activating enzyme, partial [hydrothermal vent metagenome]